MAPEKRGPYTKIDDEELLPYIIAIVDSRPTYGYRRVGALLNRKLQEDGFSRTDFPIFSVGVYPQSHTGHVLHKGSLNSIYQLVKRFFIGK